MSMKKCFIVSALEHDFNYTVNSDDLVIAVDSGLNNLIKSNIKPNVVIGDFDSLGYVPIDCEVIKLPVKKDDTDTHFAVNYAIKNGYYDIIVTGALGGRLDHTLANLQTLAFASENGCNAVIHGDTTAVACHNGKITLPSGYGKVSIFALGNKAEKVTITGLEYSVKDITIYPNYPIGHGNSRLGTKAEICVKNGTVIILIDNIDDKLNEIKISNKIYGDND